MRRVLTEGKGLFWFQLALGWLFAAGLIWSVVAMYAPVHASGWASRNCRVWSDEDGWTIAFYDPGPFSRRWPWSISDYTTLSSQYQLNRIKSSLRGGRYHGIPVGFGRVRSPYTWCLSVSHLLLCLLVMTSYLTVTVFRRRFALSAQPDCSDPKSPEIRAENLKSPPSRPIPPLADTGHQP